MANERNDTKATEMYRLYQRGFSLAQVADAFGCSRQSVHDVFSARGWARRSRPHPPPFVMFQGNKYTRRNTGYYGCTNGDRNLLHRDIWEATHGPIPEGYDIHHRDHDKTNNAIANLELVRKDIHAKLHPHHQNQNVKQK